MYYILERLFYNKGECICKDNCMIFEDWKVGIMSKLFFVKFFFFCYIYVYLKENFFKLFKSI